MRKGQTFQNNVETGVYMGKNEIIPLPHTLYQIPYLDG